MNPSEFWALVALATAMSFSPGPNTTLSTALAANGGLRHALPFVCSVPVGWALLLIACGLGLGALLLAVPALVWVIKAIGVGYLMWLALRLARSSRLGEVGAGLRVGFFQGVALQGAAAEAVDGGDVGPIELLQGQEQLAAHPLAR